MSARWLDLLPLCLLATTACGLTVTVAAPGGAPRILVDGQPVRGRMFWGGPGSRPVDLPAAPTLIEATFVALQDEPERATIHFRFGATPGTIILDDIRLTDLDTGRDVIPTCDFEAGEAAFRRDWTFWPTGEQNTVARVEVVPGAGRAGSAGLKITLTAPPAGAWPDWHIYHHPNLALVKGHRYRLSCHVVAEPARQVKIATYRPGQTFVFLGGPGDVFTPQIRLAGEAGAPFVSFPVALPWPKPGETADWAGVDNACRMVLEANPAALLIPRIPMDAPTWWLDVHPDDEMKWDGGTHRRVAEVASPAYRREAAARLAAFVEHLEATFGDRVAGYHPSGQNTGEWFYQDTWLPQLNGYAPATRAAFRQWLAAKYPTDPTVRDAVVPAPAARYAAPAGVLRDPATEGLLLDFNRFQQEVMANWVCEMARGIKQACARRKLAVFFYGYVYEFAPVGTGPATSGHYDLRQTLNSPDIDVLCAPISYHDRGVGGTAPTMTAAESVALAGKVWLNEDDTHTYLAREPYPGHGDHVTTLAATNHLLVRNIAQAVCRNLATWWMDLGSSGWFNDPGMWAEMARFATIEREFLDQPRPYRPELAAVVDEQAMIAVAAGGQVVSRALVYEGRAACGRVGAPFGQYLQDDVAAGRVPAKLIVMLTPWRLSAAERATLLAALRGRARVWCYAPGWLEERATNLAAMRELTGFELRPVTVDQALAEPTEAGRTAGLTQPLGLARAVRPLFAAADARPEETLARWPDGSAAIAVRRTPDGLSAFVGAPGLSPALLRHLASLAGVKLYCRTDCQVYANGPLVAVHGVVDGPVELDLGGHGPVVDALSGAPVAAGPRFTINLQRGETRVFRRSEG